MRLYVCGQKAFGAAVFRMCLEEKHEVVGASAPLVSPRDPNRPDRLRAAAESEGVPVLPSGFLDANSLPAGVDMILAAHSHDFIGRKTRLKARIGAIGYHPSLLPVHRGRDAVRWTVKMGDPVTGGSIYWLTDTVDGGDIAAQDYCFVGLHETPEDLWRDKLFPMGVELFRLVLRDIAAGRIIAVPQNHELATWEPSWERPPLRRPDLLMLGEGALSGFTVLRDASALHR
jgi:methionyl-tRNA formyltransferase